MATAPALAATTQAMAGTLIASIGWSSRTAPVVAATAGARLISTAKADRLQGIGEQRGQRGADGQDGGGEQRGTDPPTHPAVESLVRLARAVVLRRPHR